MEEIFEIKVLKINSFILPRKQKRLSKFIGLTSIRKRVIVKILSYYSVDW